MPSLHLSDEIAIDRDVREIEVGKVCCAAVLTLNFRYQRPAGGLLDVDERQFRSLFCELAYMCGTDSCRTASDQY